MCFKCPQIIFLVEVVYQELKHRWRVNCPRIYVSMSVLKGEPELVLTYDLCHLVLLVPLEGVDGGGVLCDCKLPCLDNQWLQVRLGVPLGKGWIEASWRLTDPVGLRGRKMTGA